MLANNARLKKTRHYKWLFYLTSIILGALFAYLYDHLNYIIRGPGFVVNEIVQVDSHKRILLIVFRGALLNWLNAFLVFHLHQMKEKEQSQLELEHLKQAHLQANLSSLKEQLSPHFLFNTFNTLASLTHEQNVKDYVDEMANVYRYLLSHQKSDWVSLKDELAFCESYLYIIKTRLNKAIEVVVDVGDTALRAKIPPLTLQLLIENAIKHNITAAYKPLKIHICTADGQLMVVNNHQPKSSVEPSSGIGLNNISQRYQLLFNRDITIENKDDQFKVALPLVQ